METPGLVAVLALLVVAAVSAADDAQLLEQLKAEVPSQAADLRDWSVGEGACRFPGAGCRGGRLTSLSLAGVPLNADFQAVAATLLQLGSLETLSLRGANVTGALATAAPTCGARLRSLDLSGNAGLRGSVADVEALAAACSGVRELNLSGNSVGGPRRPAAGGGGGSGFTGLDALDLSVNDISGDGDLRWMVGAGVGSVRRLDLSGNKISGLPEFTNCSGMEYLDLSGNLIAGEVAGGSLSDCRGLSTLNLSGNHLGGAFPPDVAGLTSLTALDLSNNNFSGELSADAFTGLQQLKVLSLSFNHFNGIIPPELAGAKKLAVLDLSHNQLEGPIPNSFSSLPLSEINLSNNLLNGSIPELGFLATFPRISYENNSGLCGFPLPKCDHNAAGPSFSDDNQSHMRKQASLIGSVTVALLLSLFCIFGIAIIAVECMKRKQIYDEANTARDIYIGNQTHSGTMSPNWRLSGPIACSINLAAFDNRLQKLTFADLMLATDEFNNDYLIGSDGLWDVYKGQLNDGKIVAIKKLKHASDQGDREFSAELETIGNIRHRNLVPLLAYCKVGEERLLVYEYMKFGSLEDVLHDDRKTTGIKLSWEARRKIAVGVARGLAFIHHNCIPHLIHRDIKSSSVLIDDNLEAKVSDFGMARTLSVVDTHLSVSTLAGTPGYVPPEYYQSLICSTKGDVYSYGVVLLELLTGKPATGSSDFGEDSNLVGWVMRYSSNKLKITDLFDPELLEDDPTLQLELLEYLKVACACLDNRPSKRPTMLKVMAMFKEIQARSTVDSNTSSACIHPIDRWLQLRHTI